jgi:hypothetical protein
LHAGAFAIVDSSRDLRIQALELLFDRAEQQARERMSSRSMWLLTGYRALIGKSHISLANSFRIH